MYKLSLALLLLLLGYLHATPIIIERPLTPTDILKDAKVFIDMDRDMTIDALLADPSRLTPFRQKKIDLGFTDAQVWIQFSLKNDSSTQLQAVLDIDNPMLDYIDLYRIEDARVVSFKQTGLLSDYDFQGPLDFSFTLDIPPGQTQEYILQVRSAGSALYFNAKLMDNDAFVIKELHHQLIVTLYLGLIIGLIIYNLFIFIFTRDKNHLYYVGYQTSMVLIYTSLTTITKHIYPPWLMAADAFWGLYYLVSASMFMLLFTWSFLKLRQFVWIDRTIKAILLMYLLLLLLIATCCYPIHATIGLTLLSSLYLIIISIYLKYKRHPYATYIMVGWSVSLTGSISLTLYQMGLAPHVESYPYLYESTVVFEAILFSIVLAKRLNHAKALAKALSTQKVLTRELHHRVKNNMQLIISLYRLKFSYVKDNPISARLIENENNIIAMSMIHEALYAQDDLERLDTDLYFKKLVELLHHTISKQNITIDYDCKTSLNPQQAIYSGIILNELVTNSIKYAFEPEQAGRITITLYDEGKKTHFEIADDGKGFDPDEHKEAFGISLVKALAKRELHATMEIDSSKGTAYHLIWERETAGQKSIKKDDRL